MAEQKEETVRIKGKEILIDSNFLLNCGDQSFGQEARNILNELVRNGNVLATSEISVYEVLRRDLNTEDESYYKKLLDNARLNIVEIDSVVICNAIVLAREIYPNRADRDKGNLTCDLIIGGTVLTRENALLLTCDRKDFDRPFWNLVSEDKILRKRQEGWDLCNVFFLEFEESALSQRYVPDDFRDFQVRR